MRPPIRPPLIRYSHRCTFQKSSTARLRRTAAMRPPGAPVSRGGGAARPRRISLTVAAPGAYPSRDGDDGTRGDPRMGAAGPRLRPAGRGRRPAGRAVLLSEPDVLGGVVQP